MRLQSLKCTKSNNDQTDCAPYSSTALNLNAIAFFENNIIATSAPEKADYLNAFTPFLSWNFKRTQWILISTLIDCHNKANRNTYKHIRRRCRIWWKVRANVLTCIYANTHVSLHEVLHPWIGMYVRCIINNPNSNQVNDVLKEFSEMNRTPVLSRFPATWHQIKFKLRTKAQEQEDEEEEKQEHCTCGY